MISKLVVGEKGVVSDHQLASLVGIDILKKGGNAFDAAIAISAVLSVVQPHSGGIGGDAFLLGFMDDDIIAYASSGRSPRGFDPDEFIRNKPLRGPLTVTIPGLVYLWGMIYEEYGYMRIEDLLEPAIKLASNGFHVGLSLSSASKISEIELSQYKWSHYFKGLELGGRYVNRDMARALRVLATRGWDEFYYGELAEQITRELQDQGVNTGLDDLMDHEGHIVEPLRLELDNMVLYELPPNTQGISTLQLISALYELELYKHDMNSPDRVLKWSEPIDNVYRFRDLYIGDPDSMTIDPQSYVKYTYAKNLLEKQAKITNNSNDRAGDTTFFIVSDGEVIIGFIQSLFYGFGSGLIISGFPVQNRAIGFAKKRGLPNSPAPGKLPLHTLSVLGVDRGDEKYIIGCVGGDMRPQLHLRVFENIFAYNMRIDKAIATPRFIYTKTYNGQEVSVEKPFTPPSGNKIKITEVPYGELRGHVHVGILGENMLMLACDPRSEGIPIAIGD
ncbi:MAG: gamma-glutamyltransferase [Desulfurococcaceae archaeon]